MTLSARGQVEAGAAGLERDQEHVAPRRAWKASIRFARARPRASCRRGTGTAKPARVERLRASSARCEVNWLNTSARWPSLAQLARAARAGAAASTSRRVEPRVVERAGAQREQAQAGQRGEHLEPALLRRAGPALRVADLGERARAARPRRASAPRSTARPARTISVRGGSSRATSALVRRSRNGRSTRASAVRARGSSPLLDRRRRSARGTAPSCRAGPGKTTRKAPQLAEVVLERRAGQREPEVGLERARRWRAAGAWRS